MIRVAAPSRLHFGLLSLGGAGARRFGGVGLMVQAPGVRVSVQPAPDWSAAGPLAERALVFAQRLAATSRVEPHHIHIEQCAPEHAGLGTGTQLAMAVGQALATSAHLELDAVELGRRVGRGQRSALGIHGFAQGGLLVDGGQAAGTSVAPLLARHDFPESWQVLLILPGWAQGLHGTAERQAFQQLLDTGVASATTAALCRLALLGMLPALVERDLTAFGEALHEFNARVGEAFAPVQGGIYAHPRLAEVVAFLRAQSVPGVGQSSWGPAIFAVVAEDVALDLARQVRERFALGEREVLVTSACNRGGRIDK
jgi:beta-ribofuranosylaminobenzene 5'-phosphate synthase